MRGPRTIRGSTPQKALSTEPAEEPKLHAETQDYIWSPGWIDGPDPLANLFGALMQTRLDPLAWPYPAKLSLAAGGWALAAFRLLTLVITAAALAVGAAHHLPERGMGDGARIKGEVSRPRLSLQATGASVPGFAGTPRSP